MNGKRGLVLFSGGVDSTIATLALARDGNELTALSINYIGRPKQEALAASRLLDCLPFEGYREVTLSTQEPLTFPNYISTKREGWIPYRNLMFWAIAAHQAAILDVDFVVAGHDDIDEIDYSDASKEFFGLLQRVLKYDGLHDNKRILKIELPVQELANDSIRQLLNARDKSLLNKTWSCWRDKLKPCNECQACKSRHRFLKELAEH